MSTDLFRKWALSPLIFFLWWNKNHFSYQFFPVVKKFSSFSDIKWWIWLKPRETPNTVFGSLLANPGRLGVDTTWAAVLVWPCLRNKYCALSQTDWEKYFLLTSPEDRNSSCVFRVSGREDDFHIWNLGPNKNNFLFPGRVNALTSFTSVHLNLKITFLVTRTEGLSICEMSFIFSSSQCCSLWLS